MQINYITCSRFRNAAALQYRKTLIQGAHCRSRALIRLQETLQEKGPDIAAGAGQVPVCCRSVIQEWRDAIHWTSLEWMTIFCNKSLNFSHYAAQVVIHLGNLKIQD